MDSEKTTVKREKFRIRNKRVNSENKHQVSPLSPQVSDKEVSTSTCCKPDFVRRPPKRLAVRSFIYPAEAKFPPKRDATYPESLDEPPDPLFCVAPEWVYLASIVTFGAVSSYLPFSPLPQASPRRLFSVTLSVTLGCPHAPPLSRGILPYGVRTFLSSPKEQANAHTPRSTHGTVSNQIVTASGNFKHNYFTAKNIVTGGRTNRHSVTQNNSHRYTTVTIL